MQNGMVGGDRHYLPRIIEEELDELLAELPAIAMQGARGVGKTSTAARRAMTIRRLDDPSQRDITLAGTETVLAGEPPILLDEWQKIPHVWDAVRRAVDDDRTPGRFILTGSAIPTELPVHSGAGRIVTIRMRPLSLLERGVGDASVSLRELLRSGEHRIHGRTPATLRTYVDEIIASGFPGWRGLSSRARRTHVDSYVRLLAEREFPEVGRMVRRPDTLLRWMRAYAAATATTSSYETIRRAATNETLEMPSRATTQPYIDALSRLWVLDPVDAWVPTNNLIRRLSEPPKHHLVDPALAARLLGLGEDELLSAAQPDLAIPREGSILGALFESLVTQSVRVYAQAAEAQVRHMRTYRGEHEVDLIIVRDDGRVVAMEVKLTRAPTDADTKHLRWLRERIGDRLLDAVIVTTGPEAYRRKDGIAVVPAALLGP